MTKFKATVYEDIPAYRLICLKGSANDPDMDTDKIYLNMAKKDFRPDMVSTKDLKEGDEVTVEITDESVWKAELSRDTPPGTLVSADGEGKIGWTNTQEHKLHVGYSIEGGKAGDVIKYVRKTGVLNQVIDGEMAGMAKNDKEV